MHPPAEHDSQAPARGGRRALRDPVRCGRCGHAAPRRRLGGPPYLRRLLAGVRHGPPWACEPDEHALACPECGAAESFDDAIACAECLEFPCICTPPEGPTEAT